MQKKFTIIVSFLILLIASDLLTLFGILKKRERVKIDQQANVQCYQNLPTIQSNTTISQIKQNKDVYSLSCSLCKKEYAEEIAKNVLIQYQKTGIEPYVIYAIIETESDFTKEAKSFLGAPSGRGLMQVSEVALKEYNNWHRKKYVKKDLYNISINLEVGCWYYTKLVDYTKTRMYRNLYVAYNVGPYEYNLNSQFYMNNTFPDKRYYGALKRFDNYYHKYYYIFYKDFNLLK
jgi:soluble lytic murein transglycosylase-like protein